MPHSTVTIEVETNESITRLMERYLSIDQGSDLNRFVEFAILGQLIASTEGKEGCKSIYDEASRLFVQGMINAS